MYFLAFAIVDSENDINWKWFLENLRLILQPEELVITFMSDRHHGLLTYIPIVFPNSHHGFCLWHLKNNLRKALSGSGRSEHIINLFERCCKAPTHEIFTEIYNDFIAAAGRSLKVLDFIDNAPRQKWANAYFEGNRYGRVCSSLSESFNSWILKEREFPITSLIDHLRVKIMKMRSKRRDACLSWGTVLCPAIFESLKETRILARFLKGDKSADGVYEVHSTKKYHVDLENRYCSCNLWRINGIPCKHAIFCLQFEGMDINCYYDHYFWTDYYKDSYSHAIHPIPTNNIDVSVVDDAIVIAPDVKKMPGRPRKNRISSSGSQESIKKPRFCSSCKEHVFHNKRTCKSSLSIPH
jgi:zinc finger SWIM domain-containing protein 3